MAAPAVRCACACAMLLAALACAGLAFVQTPLPAHGRPKQAQPHAAVHREAGAPEAVPTTSATGDAWRVALAACAALLVALVPISGAEAARSGGRMGGMRSMPPPQRSQQQRAQPGPRFSSGPNISIGVGPVIAPPMFGPPLLGPPMGLFGPPMLPVPVPSMGPSVSDQIMQDQQRRDERQMDSQKAQIEALQKEIAELKAKRQ